MAGQSNGDQARRRRRADRWPRVRLEGEHLVVEAGPTERWRTPWAQIGEVTVADDHAVVHLPERVVRLDATYGDWRAMAEEIAAWAAIEQAPLTTALTPAQLEAWLGLEPGGTLVTGLPRSLALGVLGCGAAFAALLWRLFGLDRAVGMALAPLLLCGWGVMHCATDVRADGNRLTLRRRGRPVLLAWSELRGLRLDFDRVIVRGATGSFSISPFAPHAQRLLRVIDRVIAINTHVERGDGDPGIPDGALSRLTGDGASLDRALSVAAEPEEDPDAG